MNGAIAAFVVGVVLICSGGHFAMPLFSFFYSCSRITRVRSDQKRRLDAEFKSEGGIYPCEECRSLVLLTLSTLGSRDAWQVLSNSFPALVASVAYAALCGPNFQRLTATPTLASMLIAFVFGFFACCTGDTWASELGILQTTPPRLITSGRSVRCSIRSRRRHRRQSADVLLARCRREPTVAFPFLVCLRARSGVSSKESCRSCMRCILRNLARTTTMS